MSTDAKDESVFSEENPETARWSVLLEVGKDPLTELPNRKEGEEVLQKIIDRGDIQNLHVIFIDFDRFKPINNKYGHQYGDGIMQDCAKALKESFRPSDFLFRYGGDEFVAICPDYKLEDKNEETNRAARELVIRDNIHKVLTHRSDLINHPEIGEVGATIGIAKYKKGDKSADLINRADITQYEIKHKKHETGYNK